MREEEKKKEDLRNLFFHLLKSIATVNLKFYKVCMVTFPLLIKLTYL